MDRTGFEEFSGEVGVELGVEGYIFSSCVVTTDLDLFQETPVKIQHFQILPHFSRVQQMKTDVFGIPVCPSPKKITSRMLFF